MPDLNPEPADVSGMLSRPNAMSARPVGPAGTGPASSKPGTSSVAAQVSRTAEAGPVIDAGPAGTAGADGPSSAAEALAMAAAGFGWLARTDFTALPVAARAECLRQFERIRSMQTAAHAALLAAFDADRGYQDDGQGTARTWLRWQTQTTARDAASAVTSMRRLRAHPDIAVALRDARITTSWAEQIGRWTDLLPAAARGDADIILLNAAAAGATLADLARLAEELRARLAEPDRDPGGLEDRRLRLATTLGGAGRLEADLTPQATAALQAVLDALGKKAGPEDDRTREQRDHDALHEACRRLAAAGCLPDRAGQPTQIQLHITLEELLRRLGASQNPDDGRQAGTARPGSGVVPGWPPAGPGDECDASLIPVVTGHLDHQLLSRLTARLVDLAARLKTTGTSSGEGPGSQRSPGPDTDPAGTDPARSDLERVRNLIVAGATALLSGPGGLASWLRNQALGGPAASPSLPLDVGTPTETIPAHLRRAVILRDRHCVAPGCTQAPAACQVHHVRPRSLGGITKLQNLILLCSFHHLIAVHQWGWSIRLNADGTTTMTSPDGSRTYHSHSPPSTAAA